MLQVTDLDAVRRQRGWTRVRVAVQVEAAARRRGEPVATRESLLRMLRDWFRGAREPEARYLHLLGEVFGVPVTAGGRPPNVAGEREADGVAAPALDAGADELASRLAASAAVDAGLVQLLAAQTTTFRVLDRRLGAGRLLRQTEAHVEHLTELLSYAVMTGERPALASATAQAASLAAWQALDLGQTQRAWLLHETAKAAARDSDDPAVLAHVTAQQSCVLLDLDQPEQAVALARHVREGATGRVPAVLMSWLCATEAEALAAAGQHRAVAVALEDAQRHLDRDGGSDVLPFVFLDDVHLARWRGHCLARFGAREAIDDLTTAAARLDPTFVRAAAALRVDLAIAHAAGGEHDAALTWAREAETLAAQTMSARQRRRLSRVLRPDPPAPRPSTS